MQQEENYNKEQTSVDINEIIVYDEEVILAD
jgi:hypothetical protein